MHSFLYTVLGLPSTVQVTSALLAPHKRGSISAKHIKDLKHNKLGKLQRDACRHSAVSVDLKSTRTFLASIEDASYNPLLSNENITTYISAARSLAGTLHASAEDSASVLKAEVAI